MELRLIAEPLPSDVTLDPWTGGWSSALPAPD
jgi:hypothetical protein